MGRTWLLWYPSRPSSLSPILYQLSGLGNRRAYSSFVVVNGEVNNTIDLCECEREANNHGLSALGRERPTKIEFARFADVPFIVENEPAK